MIYIAPNLKRLSGRIVVVCTYAIEGKDRFPDDMSFDDGFESIRQSIIALGAKLGLEHEADLIDMNLTAKGHFEAGETKLGASLMQDMEQVVKALPPFAYPQPLFRWT